MATSTKKTASKKKSSASSAKAGEANISFEAAMEELEALVSRMEQGDHSLEISLKDFERGVSLTRICQKALSEAEQKVQILSKNMGQDDDLQAFDADNDQF